MLNDRCIVVVEGIRRLKNARATQDMRDALRTRHQQLHEHSSQLKSLTTTMDAFRAYQISVDLKPDYGQAVLASFRKLSVEAGQDPTKWKKSGFATSELQNLTRLEDGFRKALKQAWTAHAASRVQGVGMDGAGVLLDVLAKVPSMAKTAAQVRALQAAVNARREGFPKNTEEIEIFNGDLDALAESWGRLKGDGIPQSVLAFLRQAGQGRAPLALVTDEVVAWLREHGIEDAFHVVIGG